LKRGGRKENEKIASEIGKTAFEKNEKIFASICSSFF
jgi:hypothetical protein